MFLLFNNFFIKLFDESEGTGTATLPDNKEDIIDFLNEDEPEDKLDLVEPKKSIKKEEKKTSEEESEDEDEIHAEEDDEESLEDEIEEELKGPSEDQLELIAPVRRKEILAKYPKLFQDFPYLEKAYYREQQFTEILGDINDAKIAVEKSKTLDNFEKDLIGQGNTTTILKAVKEENPKAFHKIVDNYITTLARVDQGAYQHVLGNVLKHTIISMVRESEASKNENLKAAAVILNQFAFGSSKFEPPRNLSRTNDNEENEKDKELNERQQRFVKQAYHTTVTDLNTRVNNTLMNTIKEHIDPKDSMTDYVRQNASRDAMDMLSSLMDSDRRFKSIIDKLWEKAFKDNFSPESVANIKRAWLSKSKILLPTVIKKARNEALRGMGKRIKEDNEESTTTKSSPVKNERPRSNNSSGKVNKTTEIPKGMRTLDFLMQD